MTELRVRWCFAVWGCGALHQWANKTQGNLSSTKNHFADTLRLTY